ncbi:MAG TPA: alpha/beta hydrolase domain-containing protein, partial [Acidimicrobiales bacterium]|nr:alpha/beta hydrolase domain-containing protein [Acidimicrobiales bacterium]
MVRTTGQRSRDWGNHHPSTRPEPPPGVASAVKSRRTVVVSAVVTVCSVLLVPRALGAPSPVEPNPKVSGPVTGGIHGRPFMSPIFNVADYSYSEKEFFFSGTAKAYGATDSPAAYETRMVVFAPTSPRRFSGNVVVEWDNVTGQADGPADFEWLYPQVFANGDAYVEITAQQVGVCGMGLTGAPVAGEAAACTPSSLKGFDPVRYAPLSHPGDAYAYDIFSQAMQAIRHPQGIAPLGRLAARSILAIGESQSAFELDNYLIDGADSAAHLANGFLIDSDLSHAETTTYRVPTLFFWGEDSAQDVRATSGRNHVAWSVSGAAHTDYWMLQHLVDDLVGSAVNSPPVTMAQQQMLEQQQGNYAQEGPSASATCAGGEEFPKRYVFDAALVDLEQWAGGGRAAPSVPALEFGTGGLSPSSSGMGVTFKTDPAGNALGGLREPWITVPVATYVGNACP